MKLKVELKQLGKVVFGRILEQNLSEFSYDRIVVDNGGYHIARYDHPDIGRNVLFVRGRFVKLNNALISYEFDTVEDATNWMKNINELIEDINKPKQVKIVCEGKTVEISRESAIALNLIKE